jgi:outer membrane usher protein
VGVNLARAGTLTLAYAVESFRSETSRSTMTLSHNISIGDVGFLSLAVTRTRDERDTTNAFLTFTVPMSGRRTASVVARYDDQAIDKTEELAATLQRSPPPGPGLGYRLAASTAGNYDADALLQFEVAAVDIEAARYAETSAQRGTVSGAATLLDGQVRASRSVTGSFAAVDLDGIPNVTVFVENQPVTRTDASGRALLRNLRPYEENRVSVDPAELPLDTSIDARVISIAPAYRSGVKVKFPVERERGATFTLVLPDGSFVPAGAHVEFKHKLFPVATQGMTYVTGFDHGMTGSASWPDARCTFRLEPRSSEDPLPDLGRVLCRPDLPIQARASRR